MNNATLSAQEIFLIERYISVEYFGELRDIWGEMVEHLDRCLDRFVNNLPSDYRNYPLPQQPDIVWGQKVLPNFRDTFDGLCAGYIGLSHGDFSSLGYANGPRSDFRGQMDSSSDWMDDADELRYRVLLNKALTSARNIRTTDIAYWKPYDLTKFYSENDRGPLNLPANLPIYGVSKSVSIKSGDAFSQCGIYAPDLANSSAQFLNTEYGNAPLATVFLKMEELFAPDTKLKYAEQPVFEKRPCTWWLVERRDAGIVNTLPTPNVVDVRRAQAGETCPETGYYFTPARTNSRAHFIKGSTMPGVENHYGATIWQWDSRQD